MHISKLALFSGYVYTPSQTAHCRPYSLPEKTGDLPWYGWTVARL
jgi:hypothetical protein